MYLSHRAATLTEEQPHGDREDLAALNALSSMDLDWDDVFVRSMYLCSDQPCECDWSRFTVNALEQIATLVVGQSVITGHDRRSLPLARFFKAEVIEREGSDGRSMHWVQAWFYWLRQTSGAVDLLLNIDGGIYREVSIAWRYRHWACSICGEADGSCAHRPGEIVAGERCLRVIDEIVDVLEGSLVYKSADAGATLARSIGDPVPDATETVLCVWADGNPVFRLLEERELLGDVDELSADTFEAIEESAGRVLVEDFQAVVSAGYNVTRILSPAGDLLTRETDGSVEKYLVEKEGLFVERMENEDDVFLAAQRTE